MKQVRKINEKLMVKGKSTDILNQFMRIFTMPLTRFIAKYTYITPNTVTALSITSIILAFFCFGLSGYTNYAYELRIAGAIFVFLRSVFDHVDGKLARVLGMTNLRGKLIDSFGGLIPFPLLILSMFIGLRITDFTLTIAAMIAAISFLIHYVLIYNFKAEISPELETKKIEMVSKKSRWKSIYGSGGIKFVLIGLSIANRLTWFFWIYAVLETLCSLAIMFLQLKAVQKYEKLNKKKK